MMNPDDMDDAQLMRMVTLGMAVIWTTTTGDIGVHEVCNIAEEFAAYIETGQKPIL